VRTLGLVPTDSDRGWLVRPGSRPVRSADAAADAECVLRATASDLHLLLWNRPTGEVDVAGDPAVLDDWRRRIRIRWGGPDPRRPDPRRSG
jgi:hypothetical protein